VTLALALLAAIGSRLTQRKSRFTDVAIISFRCDGGEIAVNPSLESTLKEVAFILADKYQQRLEETLLENMGDADYGDLDDYYERKRDERRGC
jgi:hypothetical protein